MSNSKRFMSFLLLLICGFSLLIFNTSAFAWYDNNYWWVTNGEASFPYRTDGSIQINAFICDHKENFEGTDVYVATVSYYMDGQWHYIVQFGQMIWDWARQGTYFWKDDEYWLIDSNCSYAGVYYGPALNGWGGTWNRSTFAIFLWNPPEKLRGKEISMKIETMTETIPGTDTA